MRSKWEGKSLVFYIGCVLKMDLYSKETMVRNFQQCQNRAAVFDVVHLIFPRVNTLLYISLSDKCFHYFQRSNKASHDFLIYLYRVLISIRLQFQLNYFSSVLYRIKLELLPQEALVKSPRSKSKTRIPSKMLTTFGNVYPSGKNGH